MMIHMEIMTLENMTKENGFNMNLPSKHYIYCPEQLNPTMSIEQEPRDMSFVDAYSLQQVFKTTLSSDLRAILACVLTMYHYKKSLDPLANLAAQLNRELQENE